MPLDDLTKELVAEAQNGYCGNEGCLEEIHSIHHMLHDTEVNRRRFPLFINSVFNLIGLCYSCHKTKQHLFRVSTKVAEMYEKWLENFKTTLTPRG